MVYAQFDKIQVSQASSTDIIFPAVIQETYQRKVEIHSLALELWLLKDPNNQSRDFLAPLSLEMLQPPSGPIQLEPNKPHRINLVWHSSPAQLEHVEKKRGFGGPVFAILSRIGVSTVWIDSSKNHIPKFEWESIFREMGSSYPIILEIGVPEWISVLDQVGFKHTILHELPIPEFPPGFARPQEHLKKAWQHHFAGQEDEALASCQKAFESLGFNLYGVDDINRAEVLDRLFEGQEERKREAVLKIWTSLAGFFHLGRHEKGASLRLSKRDGELAVVLATELLNYMAQDR